MTLNGDSGGVLSLAVREDTLYAGCQSGFIKVRITPACIKTSADDFTRCGTLRPALW